MITPAATLLPAHHSADAVRGEGVVFYPSSQDDVYWLSYFVLWLLDDFSAKVVNFGRRPKLPLKI